MHNVIRVKAVDMFPIINEILSQSGSAWITVTGSSMYPFLREDKDQVELVRCSFETIKVGDIVLIKRKFNEIYVLHRVLKKEEASFYIIGDAQQWIEGPLEVDQLIAVVSAVKRKNHIIKCSNKFLRLLVVIWRILIPFRYKILKLKYLVSKIIKMIFQKSERHS